MERGSTHYQQQIRSWWNVVHQNHVKLSHKNHWTPQSIGREHTVPNQTLYRPTCRRYHGCIQKLMSMIVPSVYAQEATVAITEQPQTEMTVSEKISRKKPTIYVSDQEVQDYLSRETGRDRLRTMFSRVDNKYSEEVVFVSNAAFSGGGFAFLIWSVIGGLQAKEKFVRQNQHTKFLTKFRAARAYRDAIYANSLKTGFKWGFRVYVFTALFLLTSHSISVYRNKSSVLEFVAAGALTCSLWRLNLGMKGFIAGGIIGSGLGLIGGTLMYGLMWACNETQEERYYWHIEELLRKEKELLLLGGKEPLQPINVGNQHVPIPAHTSTLK